MSDTPLIPPDADEVFLRGISTMEASFNAGMADLHRQTNTVWSTIVRGLHAELASFRELEQLLLAGNVTTESLKASLSKIEVTRAEAGEKLNTLLKSRGQKANNS